MILIVCLDTRGGMLFNHRRQSQDQVVRQDMLAAGQPLWMHPDSARQFAGQEGQIIADAGFLDKAGPGAYCFAEQDGLLPYLARVEKLIVYQWNRHYPADVYFPVKLQAPAWRLIQTREFAGTSHKKITKEVYLHEEMS